jgi:hypothetical protein
LHGGGPGFESPRLHLLGRGTGSRRRTLAAAVSRDASGVPVMPGAVRRTAAGVGRVRPRSGDGFGRGLTTSRRRRRRRHDGPWVVGTLTMRHAEPVGFCGRGRGRWSLGTNPGGPRLTRVCRCTRPGAAGARVRSPARTDTYHTATTQHNSNNTPNPWGRRTDAAAGAARRDHPAGACRSAVAGHDPPGGECSRISA